MTRLETIAIRAPLGLRFWDQAASRSVNDGLAATIWPEGAPNRRVGSYATSSGVVAFRDVPGLRAFEWPSGGEPPESSPFIAEVHDARGRFVTTVRRLNLPLDDALYPPDPDDGDDGVATGVPMFPAPGMTAAGGQFAIRAELLDASTLEPAAHALVVATPVSEDDSFDPFYGVADDAGRVVVLGAYPPTTVDLIGTPPSGATDLREQTWAFNVRVRYAPEEAPVPSGAGAPDQVDLFLQSEAPILTVHTPPDMVEELGVTVRYAQELVLRTESDTHMGKLLVQPAP